MTACLLATHRQSVSCRGVSTRRLGHRRRLVYAAFPLAWGLAPGGYATRAVHAQEPVSVRASTALDPWRAYRGLRVDSAMARLARAGVRVIALDSAPSTSQAPGTVLAITTLSTRGGVILVKAYRPIGTTGIQRPRYATVPDVMGRLYGDARAILTDSGFRNVTALQANPDQPRLLQRASAPQLRGRVIRQGPTGGTPVRADSVALVRIVLVLPAGPEQHRRVAVPGVIGRTVDDAVAALGQPGFTNVTHQRVNARQPRDVVIDQTPAGGATVRDDSVRLTPILLVVSLGPVQLRRVAIPGVVGRTVDDAVATLARPGFKNVTTRRVNAPEPRGVVIEQLPMGGTSVRLDSVSAIPVTLLVSLGPVPSRRVTIPGVVGQALDQARATLTGPGFTNVTVEQVHAPQPPGIVIRQAPPGGTDVRADSAPLIPVSLVLSLGPGQQPPARVGLPGVVGQPLDGARAVLAGRGFTNVTVRQANAPHPPGVVVEQAPAGGTTVPFDSVPVMAITLVVSQGPPPSLERVAVPALIGRSYAEAVDRLQAARLHPGRVDTTRAGLSRGIVAWQKPAPDSLVAAGSTVEMGLESTGGFPWKWWASAGTAAAIAAAAAGNMRRKKRLLAKYPAVTADPVLPELPGDVELVATTTLTGGPALQLIGDANAAAWQTDIISSGPLLEGGDHE